MDAWLSRYAAALSELVGDAVPVDLDAAPEAVLDLARDVAHGTERRYAPLATFLAGWFVAMRVREGAEPPAALDEAAGVARRLLPPGTTQSG